MADAFEFEDFEDAEGAECDPTPRGIVQCLRMLAQEAATLRMARTLEALQSAIATCAAEGDGTAEPAALIVPPGTTLH